MKVRVKKGKTAFVWNAAGGNLLKEHEEAELVEHDGISVDQQFSEIAMIKLEAPKVVKKAARKKAVKKAVKK